jgi:hypothetical protein
MSLACPGGWTSTCHACWSCYISRSRAHAETVTAVRPAARDFCWQTHRSCYRTAKTRPSKAFVSASESGRQPPHGLLLVSMSNQESEAGRHSIKAHGLIAIILIRLAGNIVDARDEKAESAINASQSLSSFFHQTPTCKERKCRSSAPKHHLALERLQAAVLDQMPMLERPLHIKLRHQFIALPEVGITCPSRSQSPHPAPNPRSNAHTAP